MFKTNTMDKLKLKAVISIIALILILFSSLLFANKSNQAINWSFPYFSGAANFERLFNWQISPSDFEQARHLSAGEYRMYKHQRTKDLVPNTVNNYGYVLVVLAAQIIFPFLGDLHSVILLQLLVHIAASLFMLCVVLKTQLQRYGFIFLYAANPLIVYFTTFPFYYFWMFLPSLVFAVLVLKPTWRNWFVLMGVPVLLFALLIRPTTLFLSAFFFVVAFYLARSTVDKWRVVVVSMLFIVGVGFILSLSAGKPWHTMYVGIGAYKNDIGVPDLSDNRGYEYFYSKTGVQIDTNAIYGNWNDPDVREKYNATLKLRYFEIVNENPWPLIRNALVNTLQVFSVGYMEDWPILTWCSTALGVLVLAFLVYTSQFIWILAILASAMSFSWYYPPIPAYNFAAYLLLAVGGLLGLESRLKRMSGGISQYDLQLKTQ